MSKSFKQALFSAALVWAVAYPVFGLKLAFSGVTLQVQNASPLTLTIIAFCSVMLFLRVLFAEQIGSMRRGTEKPLISQNTSDFLTQPKTQRWGLAALIVLAFIWPFFGSRGAVDIATLILIYVMTGQTDHDVQAQAEHLSLIHI